MVHTPSSKAAAPVFAARPRVLVVEADFYTDLGAQLWMGAQAVLHMAQADVTRVCVAGALEIPQALSYFLSRSLTSDTPFDAAVALGCIIRGETAHFDIVAQESARAIMDVAVTSDIPIGNGILTVENMAQAIERADPEQMNKGGGAALAALRLLASYQSFSVGGARGSW
jgi:6,7-dimethyl-8-ribityllumazine synthase